MNEPSPSLRARIRTPFARAAGRLLAGFILIATGSVWVARSGIGIADLQQMIIQHPAAPVVFLLLHIPVSLLFLPRTMMAMVAGMIFGAGWGVVWAAIGSVLGAVTGFLLARFMTEDLSTSDVMPRFGELLRRVERGGWRAVAMLRIIPVIPHSAANYALGLTRLPLGTFALGSLVGQLPMTIAFVEFGAAGDGILSGRPDWLLPTATGVAVLVLSMLLPKLLPRRA